MKHRVIPKLKKGTLGVHFYWSDEKIKHALTKKAKAIGEQRVLGKLQALYIFNKDKNPKFANKIQHYRHWLAGSMEGRKAVQFPHGFAGEEE
jgi:hypothetical protein